MRSGDPERVTPESFLSSWAEQRPKVHTSHVPVWMESRESWSAPKKIKADAQMKRSPGDEERVAAEKELLVH